MFDTQFKKDEEELEDQLANGEISIQEYSKQLRKMTDAYRAEIEEAADKAYYDEKARHDQTI